MNKILNFAKIDAQLKISCRAISIIVLSVILPIILIPIIKFTGHSEVVEEIAKVLVVLFLILKLPTLKLQIFGGISFGLFFGLSENIFYLNNIFQGGDLNVFWQKILWTIPMHIITILLILFSTKFGKKFIFVGFAVALILHILFNSFILSFL